MAVITLEYIINRHTIILYIYNYYFHALAFLPVPLFSGLVGGFLDFVVLESGLQGAASSESLVIVVLPGLLVSS